MGKLKNIGVWKQLVIVSVSSVLVGCGVAKVNIVKVDGLTTPRDRSVYYALPRAEINLLVNQTKHTTYYVKGSKNLRPLSRLCKGLLASQGVKLATLVGDSKYKFDTALSAVPDPDQVYAIELGASYFEDYDLTLSLSETGIINGAEIKAVDNTDKVVISALATAAAAYTGGTSGAIASMALATKTNKKLMTFDEKGGYGLDIGKIIKLEEKKIQVRSACDEAIKEVETKIDGLKELRERRLNTEDVELLASGELSNILNEYNKEMDRLRALLKDHVDTTTTPYERTISMPSSISESCATSVPPIALDLEGEIIHITACALTSNSYVEYLNNVAKTEALLDTKRKSKTRSEGFRYRIPMPTRLRLAKVKADTLSCSSSSCDVFFDEEVMVPQYGKVVTLPPSLGNRTAHFNTTFAPDFGMMTKLVIASKGADTEKFSEAVNTGIKDSLKKSDQKKQETLQAQVDYLKLLKEKKELQEAIKPETSQ